MELETNVIYCGDCLVKLKEIPDKSIDLIYIDHNKDNLLPMNLISLCRRCNSKINGREKVYYQLYLEAKIKEIYQGGSNGS